MGYSSFASGLCFYKLFCTFLIGGVLGDGVETVFCRVNAKKWMRRSSFVYGPVSIVWGFAFVLATVLYYKVETRNTFFLFVLGTVLGGAFEYLCSMLTEYVLGAKFWDYSHLPYNIGGRINLKYCCYWGLATVLWMQILFPVLNRFIENVPAETGTKVCNVLLCCVLVDAVISFLAIRRYTIRNTELCSHNRFWDFFDQCYNDERMEKLYQNIKICDLKHNSAMLNKNAI